MPKTDQTNPNWVRVTGHTLLAAISGRHIVYDSGATQHFVADGTTPYVDAGRPTKGGWRVDAERFYSVWPPSTHWDGYDVEVSADGTSLRFVAAGAVFAGRYADHQ